MSSIAVMRLFPTSEKKYQISQQANFLMKKIFKNIAKNLELLI